MDYRYLNMLPVLTVICFLATGAGGLDCFQCNSATDPECLEWLDTDSSARYLQATTCTVDDAKYCVKTTGLFGGVVGTQRFCSSRDFSNICQYVGYPDHDRIYRACVLTCGSNGCNDGHSLHGTRPDVLLLSLLALVLLLSSTCA